jgi:FtsH-binding integral membrane protein
VSIKERRDKVPGVWRGVSLVLTAITGVVAFLFDVQGMRSLGKPTLWIILGLAALGVVFYVSYLQKKD